MPASSDASHRTSGTPASSRRVSPRWVWWSALGLFLVAVGTGMLFRFGMVYGWNGPLELENIRHAHSHLMYFGWATPGLMALIWVLLPCHVTAPYERTFRIVAGATLAAAILAYPPFLLFGYSPVQLGSARMPIAVVGAGVNILGWYGFAGLYAVVTRSLSRAGPVLVWDIALTFLVLATFGAWGLPFLSVLGIHDPFVATALTHVFLDLFSEGWFVLGTVGVAAALLGGENLPRGTWPLALIATGLPLAVLVSLPPSGLSDAAQAAGAAGAVAVAIGLGVLVMDLGSALVHSPSPTDRRWLWGIPLALLGTKAAGQLVGALWPGVWLGGQHGIRILYLHVMLLGFVSLCLVAGARTVWGRPAAPSAPWLYAAVGAVLLSLLPLTEAWPWPGWSWYRLAAWASGLPAAAAAWMLGRGLIHPCPAPERGDLSAAVGLSADGSPPV